MAYAAYGDIESEFKNLEFSTSKALTPAEVTEFISQEEGVINAAVSTRYDTPVTGTEAVKVLKNISIAIVACRVAKILNLKKDIPIPAGMIPQQLNEGWACRKAEKLLEKIQSGKVVLDDAEAVSSGQGVSSYNSDNSICPVWKRDAKQW